MQTALRLPAAETDTAPEIGKDASGPFFGRLLEIAAGQPLTEATGAMIKTYVMEWLGTHSLENFDDYSERSYTRTYLGRCPHTGWEAIVMSWKEGNTTSIHAHPAFAGYHFADGIFKVEVFEAAGSHSARLADTLVIDRPTGLFAIGTPGRYDNHIHRITCLSSTGHSLHVYSGDALRGLVYDQAY